MKYIYLSLGGILLFTACSSSTPLIIPKYDKNEKTVKINNIVLDKVTYYTKKEGRPSNNSGFENNIKWYTEIINLDNKICDKVNTNISTSTEDKFYNTSCREDINSYYNGNCDIEKISNTNIYLGSCTNFKKEIIDSGKEKTVSETVYGICQSEPKGNGYGTKINIGLHNNVECFNYIKQKLTADLGKTEK